MNKIIYYFSFIIGMVVILTSCNKEDETIILEREIERVMQHDTVRVVDVDTVRIKDTIIVRDTVTVQTGLEQVYWYDLVNTAERCESIGSHCPELKDYDSYIERYATRTVHQYIAWIAYAESSDYKRWLSYRVSDSDEHPENLEILLEFEREIVLPARAFVQSLKEQGYGGSNYRSWLEPEELIQSALNAYTGNDPYGFLIIAFMAGRADFLLGI